jgi:hypothetical protein
MLISIDSPLQILILDNLFLIVFINVAPTKTATFPAKVGTAKWEGVIGACLDNPQVLRSSDNSNNVA